MHSRKAWLNGELFEKWLHQIFTPNVRKDTTHRVALLVDNASSHQNITVPPNVERVCLPANVTLIHQPLDMGTIRCWKVGYRRIMLRNLLVEVEKISKRRVDNRNRTKGLIGIREGYGPNMHDVCTYSKIAWENVSQDTIRRCWVRARCLPVLHESYISQSIDQTKQKCSRQEEYELRSLFQRLKFEEVQNSGPNNFSTSVQNWVNVEDSAVGRFSIACSLVNE